MFKLRNSIAVCRLCNGCLKAYVLLMSLSCFCFQTNKKKLFVLREESSSGPARLEYFDNEKKFKTGVSAKRIIVLKNCFSINAKSDPRHRHAVILYTKDDCFGVAFDSDTDCQEWLSLMLDLRSQSIEDSTLTRPLFGKLT